MSTTADTLDDAPTVHAPDYAGRWSRALRGRILELVERAHDGDGRGVRWPRAVADVLEELARYASREGECWPSQETIAKEISYSVRHVARAIADAVRVGLLVIAVPDYAARVAAGATTRYALPWWSRTVADGIRVMRRAQRALSIRTPEASRMVARAIEAVDPAALLARVFGDLPREVQAAMIDADAPRVYAAHVYRRADDAARARWELAREADPWEVVQRTQGPNKTQNRTTGTLQQLPTASQVGEDDRAPLAREAVTPSLPSGLAAVAARVAALARRNG